MSNATKKCLLTERLCIFVAKTHRLVGRTAPRHPNDRWTGGRLDPPPRSREEFVTQ